MTAKLERAVREVQRDDRVPTLTAAVQRADRPAWELTVGLDTAPGTQFRIGSVTKTFTAVLVMQLRDAGRLGLDDRLDAHLDVPKHGEVTIRRLLSHTGGLQREPFGDVWDTLELPTDRALVAELDRAERIAPDGRRWHYSNLGYALLGQLVAATYGTTYAEVLDDRLLGPLGLAATALHPANPATGYLVDAFSDQARPEPPIDLDGVGPAAQLWSTAADLARWALFLADPDPAVLAPATVEEMSEPVAVVDPAAWHTGWGLGLIAVPQGRPSDRVVHLGHDGAMPGFLAGAYWRRGEKVAAAVLGASGTARGVTGLPHRLIAASLEHDPLDVAEWRPGSPPPPELAGVLGRWWSEGFEFEFHWRRDRLEATRPGAPKGLPPAVFAPIGVDTFRTVSGREAGERLELLRAPDGTIVKMRWATYRFTRDQQTFA